MSQKDSPRDYIILNGVKRQKIKQATMFYLWVYGDGQKYADRTDHYLPEMWYTSWKGYFFDGHYLYVRFRDTKKKRDYEIEPMAYVPWPISQGFL